MLETTTAVDTRPAWRRAMVEEAMSLDGLLAMLRLDADAVGLSQDAARDFPFKVPQAFAARMRPGDPRDPLLLQVLPTIAETLEATGFVADPLEERSRSPVPGVLQKFEGRVLLVTTGACAVHCRYCFRRHFPYTDHRPWADDWAAVRDHIAADASIREVILSGGDPLALSDEKLGRLAAVLDEIPHLRRLRVHTRLPIVLPSRVDDALLEWMAGTRLTSVVVVHANHAREIDASVVSAVDRLREAGVQVLNQAVLLAGVNDDVDSQVALSEALIDAGVLPYYLFVLDPVAGAAHFDVDDRRARALHDAMAARLPGYLVPRLVREVPGASAKVPVSAPRRE